MVDWGDGIYENTAATLVDASMRALQAAGVGPGARVLDLGCGTGNAALAAARQGCDVVAVDPAARLVEVARARANAEGLPVSCLQGDASAIPAGDAAFDAVLSVFAVIFAPDAERAASELLRVVRPGGRVVVTSWTSTGGIAEAGGILMGAMAALAPAPAAPAAPARPAWGDPAFVQGLFEPRGARVTVDEETLAFTAASPEAWFDAQQDNHPVWRFARQSHADRPAAWDDVRTRSIERLRAWNEDPAAFRVVSRYLVITATRLA